MGKRRRVFVFNFKAAAGLFVLLIAGASVLFFAVAITYSETPPDSAAKDPSDNLAGGAILKPPKPLSDDYYPCSDCHKDEPTNFKRRKLEEDHTNIKLKHGDRWCLDCHDADNRDSLHLVDGSKIPIEDSWKLCVQCHGKKLEKWRLGVHGKRTGSWNGEKFYETCVTCHNPHTPRFKLMKPNPPPLKPDEYGQKKPEVK